MVRLALDLVAFCDRVGAALVQRGKVALNWQLQKSAVSALSNVGEAWAEPSVGDKRRFFRYALRSAGECQRQLQAAARVHAITPAELREGLRLLLALKSDLRRLIQWCDARLTDPP